MKAMVYLRENHAICFCFFSISSWSRKIGLRFELWIKNVATDDRRWKEIAFRFFTCSIISIQLMVRNLHSVKWKTDWELRTEASIDIQLPCLREIGLLPNYKRKPWDNFQLIFIVISTIFRENHRQRFSDLIDLKTILTMMILDERNLSRTFSRLAVANQEWRIL